jgi:hypothetical protein
MKKFLTLLISMISLTGCIRMTCMSPSCLGEETYNNLMHPKPYGARWVKDRMTKESRRSDFVQCGGSENLSEGYERQSGVSAKEFIDGLNSRRSQLWTCMEARGYVYRNPSRPGLEDECNAGACLYP